uniref:EPCAM/Trop-2 C-terminal domain-containing protein n=1 Tax=Prolemur simus TaxID=1328070 RepID=A0A8C8YII8_PROSS
SSPPQLLSSLIILKIRTNCQAPAGRKCLCENYKLCISIGSQNTVICSKPATKCLVMKAEVTGSESGRRAKPEGALQNNDGFMNSAMMSGWLLKAKQCKGAATRWAVNTAGVRRTNRDPEITCSERVRTFWVITELRHKAREKPDDVQSLQTALQEVITTHYQLDPKFIANILYENNIITIDLIQNSSQKTQNDVDVADVAYYLEKGKMGLRVNGEQLDLDPGQTLIYYVDEKALEVSMQDLKAGVIVALVVVTIAIIAGIVVLVISRKKRMGKYEEPKTKEVGKMHRGLSA